MVFTAPFIVQVVAALTIPVIFLGFYLNRQSVKKSFTWKHTQMALLLSMGPVLAILAVRDLLTQWIAVGAILLVVVAAFILGSTNTE